MTYRRRVMPLPSAPLRRPLSPAEDIAAARQQSRSGPPHGGGDKDAKALAQKDCDRG